MPKSERKPPRVLVVGTVTWDEFGDERRPGGAVSYAARALEALGIRARIVTIAGPDADLAAFEAHETAVACGGRTLAFEHRQIGGRRALRVLARPERLLTASDVPAGWDDADVLMIAPLLADDLDVASFAAIDAPLRGLLAQGLVREVDGGGAITYVAPRAPVLCSGVDDRTTVFLSAREIAGWPEASVAALERRAERLVVTLGEEGAEIRRGGRRTRVPPQRAEQVDPTGAGDTFATAFLVGVAEGASDAEAGRLAARCAAAAVQRVGPAPLPPVAIGALAGRTSREYAL